MPDLSFIPWVDIIGYTGGFITLWAMHQKTMIPLRVGGIAGNVGFIVFGVAAGSNPIFILHALLAPLNIYRMIQMMRLVKEIKEASAGEGVSLDPLIPYMKKETWPAGDVLFRKGDPPDSMVLIKSGSLLLEEIGHRVREGDVLGEIGAFTPESRRTCTAICETDCELYVLSNADMMQLFYQNPRFGFFLVRIIVRRLMENWQEAEGKTRALA
jgi:hypothetical protein